MTRNRSRAIPVMTPIMTENIFAMFFFSARRTHIDTKDAGGWRQKNARKRKFSRRKAGCFLARLFREEKTKRRGG